MGRDGGRRTQRLVFRVSVCVCPCVCVCVCMVGKPSGAGMKRDSLQTFLPGPPSTLCVSVVVNEARGVSWE